VLIIGRRNAGKTTILEKMTGSEEGAKPEIRDKGGNLVVRASLISNINSQADSYRTTPHLSRQVWRSVESISTSDFFLTPLTIFQRGMSMIDYEITYPSSPRFVFHDSRGIEAGSESDSLGTGAGEGHDSSKLRVEYIQKFINDRAQQTRLKDQLHAIW
jgi:GTPase SAR1 family protein